MYEKQKKSSLIMIFLVFYVFKHCLLARKILYTWQLHTIILATKYYLYMYKKATFWCKIPHKTTYE